MIYLDYNSSAPCDIRVIHRVTEVLKQVGNTSSVHRCGQLMSSLLSQARRRIADFLDVSKDSLLFTSGATESNHMILQGIDRDVLLISALSHPSALEAVALSKKVYHILPVTEDGLLDLDVLTRYVTHYSESSILLSLSYGESETGILQPLDAIMGICKAADVFVHLDASQALGRVPLLLRKWGVGAVSFSGHKVGAPQGVGAVYIQNRALLHRFMGGGGQEGGLRSGTPNLSGIVGFAEAMDSISSSLWAEVENKRNRMESHLMEWNPDLYIAGKKRDRLPNTSLMATGSLSSHIQVIRLDGEGICVSAGSACGAKKQLPLHSLTVMKVAQKKANSGIRVSIGPKTTWDEIDFFMRAYQRIHETALPISKKMPNRSKI